jgi:hypothetical protein
MSNVTPCKVIWLFPEQFQLAFLPRLHRLQGLGCIDALKICSCCKCGGGDACDDGKQHQTADGKPVAPKFAVVVCDVWRDVDLAAQVQRARVPGYHICVWWADTRDVVLDLGMMAGGAARSG